MHEAKKHQQTLQELANPHQFKTLYCYRHRKQKISHICIELKCQNNPLLCSECISDNLNRNYHYEHEHNIIDLNDGIQRISKTIKTQASPISKLFRSTIGRSEYAGILDKITKSNSPFSMGKDQLAERISYLKNQIELELELLKKEFQKIILTEKQQYFNILENYQKGYIRNIQYIKTHAKPMIDYENSIKYFSNRNNLSTKIMKQSIKKSDWFAKLKKSIYSATKSLQNSSYSSEMNGILYLANKSKIDMWPIWKGDETDKNISIDLKYLVKRAINQWVHTPDLKNLQEEIENQIPISINSASKLSMGTLNNEPFSKNYLNPRLKS